ncbi:permease [Alkaliphilus transvaalensis]|uniref:permease n=1 Tax=Alkaliphilus transvaalensis TaxID=114628 RepID=UPI00068609E9|nr:permease [Alkaliphilus transvaalensis]
MQLTEGREKKSVISFIKKHILLDKIMIVLLISIIFMYFFNEALLQKMISSIGVNLKAIWLYLFVSFAIGAYLQASKATYLIGRVFSNHPLKTVAMGSVFGSIVPLCSCTVIPLISVLLRSGLPISGVMSFWISSPISSIDIYVLTAGVLGFEFATARLLASIFMGMLAGAVTYGLNKYTNFLGNKNEYTSNNVNPNTFKEVDFKIWKDKKRVNVFFRDFISQLTSVTKWILLAFAAEVVMVNYMPPSLLATYFGESSILAIPLAIIIGIPAYINNITALPILKGMLESGVSHGAGLAFITAGAATSIPAMSAVLALTKRKIFILYLGLALVGSIIASFVYESIHMLLR